MNTDILSLIPTDLMIDIQAVADAISSGKPLDSETKRRVLEQSRMAQEALLEQYGTRELAVDLIRQGREE